MRGNFRANMSETRKLPYNSRMDRTSLPEHFFTGLDRGQPAELIAGACQAFRELHDVVQLLGGTLPLPPEDRALLRQWAASAPAEVRAAAVEALCAIEPVSWEELKAWALDENADVRRAVLLSMETPEIGRAHV